MSKISRRSFIKGAAASVAMAAAAGVIGIDKLIPAAQAEGELTKEGHGDGSYMTKALGHEDWIYVSTSIFEGKITACSVVSHKETIGIGNYACARIPAAIVANQSINVPNVRGCSFSSMAIKNAVKEAITLAGYNVDDFNAKVEEPDVNESETQDVDVVVVGGGTAGLVAACRLLDKGYKVLVLEKRSIPGGSFAMTYSGLDAVCTETVTAYDVDGSASPYSTSLDTFMGFINTMITPENDPYDGAMPFEWASYAGLAKATEWMRDIGIGFMTLGSFEGAVQYGTTMYLAPGCYMGGSGYAMMALAQRIEKHPNGEIKYLTKVTELLQDAPGAPVTGLKAIGLKTDDTPNGYELTVNAKAVILSSGGFARNKEMLQEYSSNYVDFFFNCASASTGEGIQMGVAAGSQVECANRTLGAYMSSTSLVELAFFHTAVPGIIVEQNGNNIGNISSGNHAKLASCLLDPAMTDFYYIFDENAAPAVRNYPAYGFNTYETMFNRNEIQHFDSLDAAVEELKLPGLPAALEANNAAARSGEPDEYGRRNCPYIDTANGVYVLKVRPTFYLTSAGLCVDPQGHVLTDSWKMDDSVPVIPNLYACGDVCGAIEEKDGKRYGNGFDNAIGFAYVVGETVAEAIG